MQHLVSLNFNCTTLALYLARPYFSLCNSHCFSFVSCSKVSVLFVILKAAILRLPKCLKASNHSSLHIFSPHKLDSSSMTTAPHQLITSRSQYAHYRLRTTCMPKWWTQFRLSPFFGCFFPCLQNGPRRPYFLDPLCQFMLSRILYIILWSICYTHYGVDRSHDPKLQTPSSCEPGSM